jgi:hypothetical protein
MGRMKDILIDQMNENYDEDDWKYLKGMEAEQQIEFVEQLEKNKDGKYGLYKGFNGIYAILNNNLMAKTLATSDNVQDLISYLTIMQVKNFKIKIS